MVEPPSKGVTANHHGELVCCKFDHVFFCVRPCELSIRRNSCADVARRGGGRGRDGYAWPRGRHRRGGAGVQARRSAGDRRSDRRAVRWIPSPFVAPDFARRVGVVGHWLAPRVRVLADGRLPLALHVVVARQCCFGGGGGGKAAPAVVRETCCGAGATDRRYRAFVSDG